MLMAAPLTFVCWRWTPRVGYRSVYPPSTVTILRNMIRRHYPNPHRFVCVTDRPDELDRDIEAIPLWHDYRNLPAPQGPKNPSCYVRLKAYAAEIGDTFGPRFVSMDLDTVIVRDIRPLFDRPEDFVIWGDTNRNTYYNGGLVLMTAGARKQVWERFDPERSPREAAAHGCFGSDQGWISYCLGPGERKWTRDDGVYSFRNDIAAYSAPLPANARLVSFHGAHDPWSMSVQDAHPWVKEFYR